MQAAHVELVFGPQPQADETEIVLQADDVDAGFERHLHQRLLGGGAEQLDLAVFVTARDLDLVAQGADDEQVADFTDDQNVAPIGKRCDAVVANLVPGSASDDFRDRHAVFGDGPGLVETDRLHRPQRLHGLQPAHEHPVAAQVGDAHGEIDGGRGRQAFGHRRGRQRNGQLEHLNQTVPAHEPDPEHYPADGAAGDDELVAHQGKLQLNRGLGRFGFREHGLQHADLGEAAGRHHHGQALPARHQRAHVDHVGSVGERGVLVLQAPGVLVHRHALTGQHGFVDAQPMGLDDAAVGGHVGPGFQN